MPSFSLLRVLQASQNRPALVFSVITAAAFCIRLTLLILLQSEYFGSRFEADRIADSVIHRGAFADPYLVPTGPTAHHAPGLPLIHLAIRSVFRSDVSADWARSILWIFTHSVVAGVQPLVAQALGLSFPVGLLAGTVMIFPWRRNHELYFSGDESLVAIVLMALLILTWRAWRQRSSLGWRSAVVHGCCWGVAFHETPTLLTLYLALLLVQAICFRATGGQLRWAAISLFAAALIVTPWTIRNRIQMGSWIFMRDNVGMELRIAFNDVAQAADPENQESLDRFHALRNAAVARQVAAVGEFEFNRTMMRNTLEWMTDHPGRSAELIWRRFILFWFGWWRYPGFALATALFTICAFLGGIQMLRSGHPTGMMLLTVWLAFPPMYYLVHFLPRYRAPIDWTIILAASVFVVHRAGKWFGPTADPEAPPLDREDSARIGAWSTAMPVFSQPVSEVSYFPRTGGKSCS